MAEFKIQKPMWGGRYVGLAEHRIEAHNIIEILYVNQHGERIYPKRYSMTANDLASYPRKQFRKDMPLLVMVPIANLKTEDKPDV